MTVEVVCSGCAKKLRVAEKYAGKRAKCPSCGHEVQIPTATAPPIESKAPPEGQHSSAAIHPAMASGISSTPTADLQASHPQATAADRWYMQTDKGEQYGPVPKAELDAWVREGRIDSECQVLNEQWNQWKWADEVYPQLAATAKAMPPVPPQDLPAGELLPSTASVSDRARHGPAQLTAEVNPFATPRFGGEAYESSGDGLTPRAKSALAETRPWVLFFAILGFIGCGFAALGAVVYTLGALVAGGFAAGVGLGFGVVMLATAALYGFAAYHLLNYSGSINLYLQTAGAEHLEAALESQKSFWKLVGIVSAVFLGVYIVLLVLAAIGVLR